MRYNNKRARRLRQERLRLRLSLRDNKSAKYFTGMIYMRQYAKKAWRLKMRVDFLITGVEFVEH